MPEKAATIKRFEYSALGKSVKAQTDITKKQYQGLDKSFISNKDIKNLNESLIKKEPVAKKMAKKKYSKSNLIYNRLRVYSYSDYKKLPHLLNINKDQNIHIYQIFMMIYKN